MLSLLLLGTPQILRDGHPLQIPRRKNRALLFYLVAHPKPLTRDQILALLFIDHERAAGQQILRTMLYDLRKQLGDALVIQDETLALAAETFVDARVFESNLQSPTPTLESLLSNLQLYRGDFLEGFTLPDVPEFDDWAARERERYRELAIRGWMHLATQFETAHDNTRTLDALNRALAFDPLNEQVQRHALRAQYASGDRAGAIRRFEQLQKRLDEELGVPPMAETRAVYDAIVTDKLATENRRPTTDSRPPTTHNKRPTSPARIDRRPSSAVNPSLPFVGRANELEQLKHLAATGRLIWIQGEPGIGKTRLVQEFIDLPENADMLVLRGAAHELEQNLPYQPMIDALRDLYTNPAWEPLAQTLDLAPVWWAELARLTPELDALVPNLPKSAVTTDPARVWEAFYQLLIRLGATRSVIFLLDDAHWADTATLGVLGYLARRELRSVGLIATVRSRELSAHATALVQALTREERMALIEMRTLSAHDLETLAAQLTPSHSAELAAWLNANAEGNPFFINELLRFAYDNDVLKRDGNLAAKSLTLTTILTPTIRNLIQSRVLRLNDTARRVLQTACVIGREFDFALVMRAAELSEDATLDALDMLLAAGLVRAASGDTYAFDHQLTMQYAYQELGTARQRVLHRRVAEALSELHRAQPEAVAGLIVRHFVQGGAADRAGGYALRAARYAARLPAWAEAIGFYELALQAEHDADARAKILVALGDAQFHQAAFALATESYRQSLELARASNNFGMMEEALLALTQSLFPQALYAEAIAFAREMQEAGPSELRGAAEFAWGTTLAVESAHPVEAEAHLRAAEEFLAQPMAYVTRVTLARRKYQLAAVLGQQGNSHAAVATYREALEIFRADPSALDITRTIMLHNNLGYHLQLLGEYAQATDLVRSGIRFAREMGSTSHLPYLLSTLGEIALSQGKLDEAEQSFAEGLAVAEKIPFPERIAGNLANLGLVAKARGQDEQARQQLSEALERADTIGNGHLSVRIRIWLAPLLERAEQLARLAEARQIAADNGYARLLEEAQQLERGLIE